MKAGIHPGLLLRDDDRDLDGVRVGIDNDVQFAVIEWQAVPQHHSTPDMLWSMLPSGQPLQQRPVIHSSLARRGTERPGERDLCGGHTRLLCRPGYEFSEKTCPRFGVSDLLPRPH